MSADTILTPSGHRVSKLVRMPDGGVAGGAGLWSSAYAGLCWLAEGGSLDGKGERSPPDLEDAEILIMRPDGSLWCLQDKFPAYPLLDKFTAIGCGSDYARAWMETGLSSAEAVAKVAKRDPGCGEPVQTMHVEQPHEFSPAVTHKAKR